MNILVTGGAGFIGSHLVDRLVEENHNVTVVDNLSSGDRNNINEGIKEFYICDIRSENLMNIFINEKIELVFHLAAIPKVVESVEKPVITFDVNVNGVLNVLNCSIKNKIDKFIFASSAAVYGGKEFCMEKDKTNPKSPYALHKKFGEDLCKMWSMMYGLRTVSLRFFNIFGERQSIHGQYATLFPSFISSFINNLPHIVYGDGCQTRDFTYVSNVVDALLLSSISDKIGIGECINIGTGVSSTVNDIENIVQQITNGNSERINKPSRIGDVRNSLASIEFAHDILKYNPKVNVIDGLKKVIEFWMDND